MVFSKKGKFILPFKKNPTEFVRNPKPLCNFVMQ